MGGSHRWGGCDPVRGLVRLAPSRLAPVLILPPHSHFLVLREHEITWASLKLGAGQF